MISLDSLDYYHDNQRPLINGKPSSVQAVNTLDGLRNAGAEVCVSITVSRQPASSIIKLIDYLLDRDVPFTLNFARDNNHFRGRDLFLPQHPELIKTCVSIIDHLCTRLPARSLAGALLDRASLTHPHHYACGVGHSYLVIDQQGRVARCQQEIETSVSSISEHDLLLKVFNSPVGVQNLSVDERSGCRHCCWRYWCAGGCSALAQGTAQQAHQGTAHDGRSPYCDVYMSIFPHVVRLEGLRLLRYRPYEVQL